MTSWAKRRSYLSAPLSALLALLFVITTIMPAFALTTGSITGQVVDATTKAPIAGVLVTAASPSESHTATTDARGFYSMTGVNSDTYTISFSYRGYEAAAVVGITVYPDQEQKVGGTLSKSLALIGRTTARSTVGAFQPTQTLDTYSVNPKKLEQLLGKQGSTSESALVYTLPGAESAGNPSLRGGRTNQIGWTWEGITDIDPSTNQFGNSLLLNGIQTLSLTPGAGSASNATAGTGTVNLTLKRGTRPPFGSVGFETDAGRYRHRLVSEYGFATPDGRLSEYVSFTGTDVYSLAGPRGTPQVLIGNYYGNTNTTQRDIVSNLVYRFGKDNSQSFQFAAQDIVQRSTNDIGGASGLFYSEYDPNFLVNLRGFTGLSNVQIQRMAPLLPNQPIGQPTLAYADSQIQPNGKIKLEYANNINSSTFLTARIYRVNSVGIFDFPSAGLGPIYQLQGGYRSGIGADLIKQLNDKTQIVAGGRFEYEKPTIDGLNASLPYQVFSRGIGLGSEVLDFVNLQPGETCSNRDTSQCGYLYRQPRFAGVNQLPLPMYDRIINIPRGIYSFYIQDQYQATRKLKLDLGLRLDKADTKFPSAVAAEFAQPSVLEPRTAFSYQIGRNDAIRGSYGRTVNFPNLSNIQSLVGRDAYQAFVGIPSYDVSTCTATGKVGTTCTPGPAKYCGVTANQTCADYAEQLYWETQLTARGSAILQPLRPETFSNFDFSFSHQFSPTVGLKVSPFYRRGYNVQALTQTPKLDATGNPILTAQGGLLLNPAVATNLGIERSTGVEFLLTKDADVGFSGQISATYVNELTNSIPLSTQENVFPSIPLASLALGHVYRAGYLSPFVATGIGQYKFKSGFRFNTQLSYNKGYPLGTGLIAPIFVNGKAIDVKLTDLTQGAAARGVSNQYVDPSNPGSYLKPNVAASLGTPEGPSPGAYLNNARIAATMTLEYAPPKSSNTIGVQIANPFGNIYARPTRNGRVQPVATGVLGPATGNLTRTQYGPSLIQPDQAISPDFAFGRSAYLLNPSGQPTTLTLYYYLKL